MRSFLRSFPVKPSTRFRLNLKPQMCACFMYALANLCLCVQWLIECMRMCARTTSCFVSSFFTFPLQDLANSRHGHMCVGYLYKRVCVLCMCVCAMSAFCTFKPQLSKCQAPAWAALLWEHETRRDSVAIWISPWTTVLWLSSCWLRLQFF